MSKNDDRRRKIEAGGKNVSVILSKEGQEALALLCDTLARQGRPSSKEAAINRALTWAADKLNRGDVPPAKERLTIAHESAHEETRTPAMQPRTVAHESAHEPAHENVREHESSVAERLSALEERVDGLEQAMIHGVQPGQWGGF